MRRHCQPLHGILQSTAEDRPVPVHTDCHVLHPPRLRAGQHPAHCHDGHAGEGPGQAHIRLQDVRLYNEIVAA